LKENESPVKNQKRLGSKKQQQKKNFKICSLWAKSEIAIGGRMVYN